MNLQPTKDNARNPSLSSLETALAGIDPHIWSSEVDCAQTMVALLKMHGGKDVLEIGVFKGKTSAYLVDGLPEYGSWTGIDIEDLRNDSVKDFMNLQKTKQCELIIGPSLNIIPTLSARKYDLIFIDSVHELNYLRNEFKACERVIKQNGLICMHDSIHMQGVKDWVNYIIPLSHFEVINFNTSEGRGLAVAKCLMV